MIRYAATQGLPIPPGAAEVVRDLDTQRSEAPLKDGQPRSERGDYVFAWRPQPKDAGQLAGAHRALARVVAPATPKSITLLNEQSSKHSWLNLLGPVLVVRVMILLAIGFLIAFIALLPTVNTEPIEAVAGTGNQQARSWWDGIRNAVYILLAAGLGVLFSELYRINRQIVRGRYDEKEDAAHMTTIVLGLIAGVMLALLLSALLGEAEDGLQKFSQPLLALLGGFSAPAVHRILTRIVDMLATLVGGDPREQVATAVEAATARTIAAAEQDRRQIAAAAMRLSKEAEQPAVPESVRSQIRLLIDQLVTEDGAAQTDVASGNARAQATSDHAPE